MLEDLFPIIARHAADVCAEPGRLLVVNKAWHAAAATRLKEIQSEFLGMLHNNLACRMSDMAEALALPTEALQNAVPADKAVPPLVVRGRYNPIDVLPYLIGRAGGWAAVLERRQARTARAADLEERRTGALKRRRSALDDAMAAHEDPNVASLGGSTGLQQLMRSVDPDFYNRVHFFKPTLTGQSVQTMINIAHLYSACLGATRRALNDLITTGPPAVRRAAESENAVSLLHMVHMLNNCYMQTMDAHKPGAHAGTGGIYALVVKYIDKQVSFPIEMALVSAARSEDKADHRAHESALLEAANMGHAEYRAHKSGLHLHPNFNAAWGVSAAVTARSLIARISPSGVTKEVVYRVMREYGVLLPVEQLEGLVMWHANTTNACAAITIGGICHHCNRCGTQYQPTGDHGGMCYRCIYF
jgi:hypothetical protein